VQDQYFEFLQALGVPHEPVVWNIGPWPAERAWQQEFYAAIDRPAAAIVVATSKPQKDWPAERWAEVCDALVERHGLQPVLVGGRSPRELHAEEVIFARARHRPVSALGSGLRRLVAILDGAALVLSPDTGPLHMAVALGRPGGQPDRLLEPEARGPVPPLPRPHDRRVRRAGRGLPDLDGEPRRPHGAHRVDDVLAKVELWKGALRGARASAGRADDAVAEICAICDLCGCRSPRQV
jgi:heptosyltransferase I